MELLLFGSTNRASTRASAAVNTFVSVDYILTVLFSDGTNRATVSASAATETSISIDNVRHSRSPFLDSICFSFLDVYIAVFNTLHLYSIIIYEKVKCFFVFSEKSYINKSAHSGKNSIVTKNCSKKETKAMNMDKETYGKFVKARMPKSPILKDCALAFLIGGLISALAECLFHLYLYWMIPEDTVKILVPVTLVFLASLLTGFGIFDDIARFAGAGTLVPITGFANAVTAPAIENKSEGFIMGVGAKMFTIAGPVIVYGTASSVLYGVIYWALGMIGG